VTWSVQEPSGGSVTNTGVFTGNNSGTYHVVATQHRRPLKSAAATCHRHRQRLQLGFRSFAGLLPLSALLGCCSGVGGPPPPLEHCSPATGDVPSVRPAHAGGPDPIAGA
jgi:hypothetical protein